jgi:GntR family transcriptional regulator
MYGFGKEKQAPLSLAVSSTNPDPMYRQVTDQITHAIAEGSLAPGTKLPSIRETARMLGLSHITVKRAYSDLEQGGYIITRPGLGSFVAGVSRLALREQKIEEVKRELARTLRTAKAFGVSLTRVRMLVNDLWPR